MPDRTGSEHAKQAGGGRAVLRVTTSVTEFMAALGRVLRATQGKRYRFAFVLQFAPGMAKCVAHGSCARRLVTTARCGREPGESAAAKPLVAAPFDLSLRGTLTAVAPRGRRGRCARGGASLFLAYMFALPTMMVA